MAWGKKPWEGGTKYTHTKNSRKELAREYEYQSYNVTSQYQNKREAANTVKGFVMLAIFLIGTIMFINWIANTFGH